MVLFAVFKKRIVSGGIFGSSQGTEVDMEGKRQQQKCNTLIHDKSFFLLKITSRRVVVISFCSSFQILFVFLLMDYHWFHINILCFHGGLMFVLHSGSDLL